MVNLHTGDQFKIISTKHDGLLHRSWEKNIVLSYENGILVGGNNQTLVTEANGNAWRTTEPALFYFTKQHWFNVIIVFEKSEHYYYCNISSPFKWIGDALHYIDYDIDLIVKSDYTYDIVDENEFVKNKQTYLYPDYVEKEAYDAIDQLVGFIEMRKGPFSPFFIQKWRTTYNRFIEN